MSFLRRFRRDKEEEPPPKASPPKPAAKPKVAKPPAPKPAPPEEKKELPAEPTSEEVTIYGGDLPPTQAPSPEPEAPAVPVTPTPPPAPRAPPSPVPAVPPPLPEPGPAPLPRVVPVANAYAICFVCGSALEGKHCPTCQMTWAE